METRQRAGNNRAIEEALMQYEQAVRATIGTDKNGAVHQALQEAQTLAREALYASMDAHTGQIIAQTVQTIAQSVSSDQAAEDRYKCLLKEASTLNSQDAIAKILPMCIDRNQNVLIRAVKRQGDVLDIILYHSDI